MGSLRKNETREHTNTELNHLSKYFKILTIDHKKGVLKTARGLLKIQRTDKTMSADNIRYVDVSPGDKNEAKTKRK
ncbi:MAG: hypothetical protein LBB81_10125 [Treponema sp.]|nr:hypothetical protein [Treponema sp.]